jgi:hypothetical protein
MSALDPRPLLLLDVDGVLVLKRPAVDNSGAPLDLGDAWSDERWLAPGLAPMLARLGAVFDLAWNTRWGDAANDLLGRSLGLPRLPFVDLTAPDCRLNKLPAVQRMAGRRALAWIDDDLDASVHVWAARREHPTLLVEADAINGMVEAHVERLLAFAASLKG